MAKIIPPEILLDAYAQGVFPMAETRYNQDVDWYLPKLRGIIEIDSFHVSKNVKRLIKQKKFEVKINSAFRKVMENCANRKETWINDLIIDTYQHLNKMGYAHSVEIWQNKRLIGGLYGVHIGAAFFGESMFKMAPEADKIALYYCYKILKKNNFLLWDTQFYTQHLSQFGCVEITMDEYFKKLETAIDAVAEFKL